MKNVLLLFFCVLSVTGYAQNVGIGTKQPQSKLHVAGSLRVDSLASKSGSGLVLHDKAGEVHSLQFTGNKSDVLVGDGTFASASALAAAAALPAWQTLGNAGIDEALNFLGTTDNKALLFRINNIKSGILNPVSGNIAFGKRALQLNRLVSGGGFSNIAIGTDALKNNVSGKNLIAIGDSAMFSQTGFTVGALGGLEQNLAIGSKALYSNVEGEGNTAVGVEALYKNKSGANTAVGFLAARNTTGNANSAFGNLALAQNTTGYFNTAIGFAAVYLGGGTDNTGVGFAALEAVTGTGNTAIGSSAMSGPPTLAAGGSAKGNYNTAVGYASFNVGIAPGVATPIGSYNAALGSNTLYSNVQGYNNVAVGADALYNNTSAYNNVSVGYQSLYTNTTGRANTAEGYQSLYANTTGVFNTAQGALSLKKNTTGTGNTAIGFGADVTAGTFTNATAIGYNTLVNASNKVRIGNAAVTKIEGQVPFTTPSDGRFKFNIRKDVGGLDFIMKLNPVTYQFDVKRFDNLSAAPDADYDKATELRRTGFIAQEVEKAAKETGFDFSGVVQPESETGHYSLSYESFVVPLVKAMQEQQALIVELRKEIDALKMNAGTTK